MSENRVIGRNNDLPWHLPEDLKYFKRTTLGKAIIMGRVTFDSIGKPLPGRTNIVITRDKQYQKPGIEVVHSLDQALEIAKSHPLKEGVTEAEVVVVGGADIYALALSKTDRLYLTAVHSTIEGDTFFPEFDQQQWQLVKREDHKATTDNPYDYSFLVLDRV